jgi:hypothetical protein
MRIRMGELRRIIREVAVVGQDLAVFVDVASNGFKATVYDPVVLEDLVLDSPEILSGGPTALKGCVVGRVQIVKPEAPCWGAMKVASIAGPGKLMYGLAYALSPSGLLISDREPNAMTTQSISAWRKMAMGSSRGRKKLDNIVDPQTPEPEDDCDVRPEEFLNYAYAAEGWEGEKLRSLQAEHERLVKRLTSDGKLSRLPIELAISSAGFAYFQARYRAAL